MDENQNNANHKECRCNEEHWIKFAFIALAVFLGVFFATYYIMDQIRHFYGIPYHMDNLDRILREQDRVFNDFNKIPIGFQAAMNEKDPVSVESFKDEKAYKIIIDLKPFDNNINNVDVKIDGRKVTVSGIKFKDRHNREDLYTFSQTFLLPQEVDSLAVTKEKVKDKYVITLPIMEEDD